MVEAVTGIMGVNERKKGRCRPVQALCGTFTPTAAPSSKAVLRRMDISFSKLTRFNTRLRLYASVVSPECFRGEPTFRP